MLPSGDQISGPDVLCRLWVHETLRVFYDRLVTPEDKSWLWGHVKEMAHQHFSQDMEHICAHIKTHQEDKSAEIGEEELRRLMCGDYHGAITT